VSYVAELKNFGLDYLVEGSAACVAMSRAIINKLPVEFRRVLIECTRGAFTSLNDLFSNYNNIIEGLAVQLQPGVVSVPEVTPAPAKKPPVWVALPPNTINGGLDAFIKNPSMRSSLPSELFCKFCGIRGHATGACPDSPRTRADWNAVRFCRFVTAALV
jgi:hypothetical protein